MSKKSITTKSFGKSKKINLTFTDTGALIWHGADGNPIPGLPKKAFVLETDSKEARAEFYIYKAAITQLQIEKLEQSLTEAKKSKEDFDNQAKMILSGEEEKLKLQKEEEKLLAKLAKIQEAQKSL